MKPTGDTTEYDVMVTILTNKRGLSKALHDSQLFTGPLSVDAFFCKFNQSQPLFQFVDCGDGKERVDSKLRGKSMAPNHLGSLYLSVDT